MRGSLLRPSFDSCFVFKAMLSARDFRAILGKPSRLGYKEFVDHLPHLGRVTYRTNERVMQHGLFEQGNVSSHGGTSGHTLDLNRGCTGGGGSNRGIKGKPQPPIKGSFPLDHCPAYFWPSAART